MTTELFRARRCRPSAVAVAGAAFALVCGCASGSAQKTAGNPAAPPADRGGPNAKPPVEGGGAAGGKARKPSAGPETVSPNLLAIDVSTPAASDIQQKLVAPRQSVEAEMQEVLGESARELTRGKPESLLGNMIVDMMREEAGELTGKPVDVAFTNLGGLRANLPKGPLTRGSVLEVMPFDNAIVVFELSGADLEEVLARMALRGGDPVSGVQYRLENQKALNIRVGGQPLDPARTYRVCTNDYIMDGGGKYESLKRAKNVNRTGVGIRDTLVSHIQRLTAAGRKLDSSMGDRVELGAVVAPAKEAAP